MPSELNLIPRHKLAGRESYARLEFGKPAKIGQPRVVDKDMLELAADCRITLDKTGTKLVVEETLSKDGSLLWHDLMDGLQLPQSYQIPVAMALGKPGWRKAKYPRAYIRTAAQRIGEDRLKLPAPVVLKYSTKRAEKQDERIAFGSAMPTDGSGVWKSSGAVDESSDGWFYDDEGRPLPGGQPVLLHLTTVNDDDQREINYVALAEEFRKRGIDSEFQIFVLRSQGFTRQEILALAGKDEKVRNRLQATYKRFSEKFPIIRQILFGESGKSSLGCLDGMTPKEKRKFLVSGSQNSCIQELNFVIKKR